jgi:hypothetical protein
MRRRSDRAAMEAEIDQIRSLGLGELRKRWSAMFGAPLSPGFTKDIIARAICYRIQEEAFGGLNRETVRLLDSLACDPKPGEFNRRFKPGTVLFREYNGERHTVTVAPEGYLWQGTTYSSLSTIARAITGTAWNGPRFFGLRSRNNIQREAESLPTSRKKLRCCSNSKAPRVRHSDE